MLECLICSKFRSNLGTRLIEAFQHLTHQFLVCKNCFRSFLRQYNYNAFYRVSLVGKEIPFNIRKLQKALIKFIDREKIEASRIFNISIIELYQNYMTQKNQSQELSTEFSSYENSLQITQVSTDYGYYSNFGWVKQKLLNKYNNIKDSSIVNRVGQNMIPIKDNIVEQGSRFSSKLSYIKGQLKSLKREAPSLKDLKQIDIGNFFKSKYKKLF